MVKSAILGGTFDPIHNGHIQLAEYITQKTDIEEIIFLPAGCPWQKKDYNLATPKQRLSMVELAIKPYKNFSVSRVEIDRTGNTYTIDTLLELKQNNPLKDLFFIMGLDSLWKFNTWKNPQKIIELCTIITVPRTGFKKPTEEELEKIVSGLSKKFVYIDCPKINVSASLIRERIHNRQDIKELVPKKVEEYIINQGLYKGVKNG